MPNDSDRLQHIEQQQERIIQAIIGLTSAVGAVNGTITTLAEWLQAPPKQDLAGAVKALISVVGEMRTEIQTISLVITASSQTTRVRGLSVRVDGK